MSILHIANTSASRFDDLVNTIDWETKRKNKNWLEIFHSMTDDNPTVEKYGYQHPEKPLQLHAFRYNERHHYGTLLGVFNTETNMYEGMAHVGHRYATGQTSKNDAYPKDANWKKLWNTVLLHTKAKDPCNPLQLWRENFAPHVPSLKPSVLDHDPLWCAMFQDTAETWLFATMKNNRSAKIYNNLDENGKFFVLQSLDSNSKEMSLESQLTLAMVSYYWMYYPETRPNTCLISPMHMGDRMVMYIDHEQKEPVRFALAITDYTRIPSMFNNIRPMFAERFDSQKNRIDELLDLIEHAHLNVTPNATWDVKIQSIEQYPNLHSLDIQTPDTDTSWALRCYANTQPQYIKQYNEAVDIANQLYPEYKGEIRKIHAFNEYVVHPVPWTTWLNAIKPQAELLPDNNILEYFSADSLS